MLVKEHLQNLIARHDQSSSVSSSEYIPCAERIADLVRVMEDDSLEELIVHCAEGLGLIASEPQMIFGASSEVQMRWHRQSNDVI